jgi:hypothetical protein
MTVQIIDVLCGNKTLEHLICTLFLDSVPSTLNHKSSSTNENKMSSEDDTVVSACRSSTNPCMVRIFLGFSLMSKCIK